MSSAISEFNRQNFNYESESLEHKISKTGTLTARAVSWFKGENDNEFIRTWKRIGAIALAVLLVVSLVGIPLLINGIYDWQRHNACKIEPYANDSSAKVTTNDHRIDVVEGFRKNTEQNLDDDLYGFKSEEYQRDQFFQGWITQEEISSDHDLIDSLYGLLQESSEEINKETLNEAVSKSSLNHAEYISQMINVLFQTGIEETQTIEEYDWSYLEGLDDLPDPITSLQTLDLSDLGKLTQLPKFPDLAQNNFSNTVKMGKSPVTFPHGWYHYF